MNPDALFLRTIDELRQVLASPDDYSVLRSTALLRQLLNDGNALVGAVNRARRMKIKFIVCDLWDKQYSKVIMCLNPSLRVVLDGLSPRTNILPGVPQKELTLDEFLKFHVAFKDGVYVTVLDLIKHCANVLGGVHLGSPKTDVERELSALYQTMQVNDVPVNLRQLMPILHVVVDGLEQLYRQIQADAEV